MIKILVTGPNLKLFGGVSFLLKALEKKRIFDIEDYFSYGNTTLFGNIVDLKNYFKRIKPYDVIHLNPSFEYKSIFRDLIYAQIAIFSKKKVIVSWMGWNENVENFFLQKSILKYILVNILNQVSVNIVSNELFKKKLKKLGVKKDAVVIFPSYDFELEKIEFESKFLMPKIKLLFIARIENSKGIDKLINIFEILHVRYPEQYEFTIGGDGPELDRIKLLSQSKKIPINYTGYIKGKEKIKLLKEHHIFLFPSNHAEGIPLILAEAMKAGLFLIVSNTGGIASVISDNNGIVLDKKAIVDEYVEKLLSIDKNEFHSKSTYNIAFANNNFSPDSIAKQYRNVYGDFNE